MMYDAHEKLWDSYKDLRFEKILKAHLKSNDPGKTDFSEEFLDRLHDKVMKKVQPTTQIRRNLPRRFKARLRLARKVPSYLVLAVLCAGLWSDAFSTRSPDIKTANDFS